MLKKSYFLFIIYFIFLFNIYSQEDKREDTSKISSNNNFIPVPQLTGRVIDLTNTLTIYEIESLSKKLEKLELEKGSQIAVLLIPTTGIETIEEYSIKVAEKWKIGREGIDDGVILLVAKNDRRMRIEVGYGLEGAIPDAIAKRIIEEIIIPEFKKGNFYYGIDRGIDALITLIKGEELPLKKDKKDSSPSWLFAFGPAFFSFILHIFVNTIVAVIISFLIFSIVVIFFYEFSWELLGLVLIMSIMGVTWYRSKDSGRWGKGSTGSGGSFSGGGGSFGGGGASGRW